MEKTQEIEFLPVHIAVMTVSDTRTLADDRSGDTLVERLEKAGHVLAGRAIIKDEAELIADKLREWIDNPEIDAVITTGGTGVTGRDVFSVRLKSGFHILSVVLQRAVHMRL